MTGIYKITSPSGNAYIGQSWDIPLRWKGYRKAILKRQPAIYRSIVKYGIENHSFEVLHELPKDVDQEVLDRYEKLYMDAYRDVGIILLNVRGAGSRGKLSEESKAKISAARIGMKQSDELKARLSKIHKGRKKTDEHKHRIGEAHRGKQGFKGMDNGRSKLTDSAVLEIRAKYKPRTYTQLALSKEYGVALSTIERIFSGKMWSHV